jgi:molybdopterin/thiamine biosynthesis adenylyltransferase
MDTCIQDASTFFNGFVICSDKNDDAETISWLNDIDAKLVDAEDTWFKYLYAICPSTSCRPLLRSLSRRCRRFALASRVGASRLPRCLRS